MLCTNRTITQLLEAGYDLSACDAQAGIHVIRELLGHSGVKTTMIYTYVLYREGRGVQSLADRLLSGVGNSCEDVWDGG